ncbi:hypothetical protein SRIMM317S_02048 [Streptomyces rimosus subsp. rimosus]
MRWGRFRAVPGGPGPLRTGWVIRTARGRPGSRGLLRPEGGRGGVGRGGLGLWSRAGRGCGPGCAGGGVVRGVREAVWPGVCVGVAHGTGPPGPRGLVPAGGVRAASDRMGPPVWGRPGPRACGPPRTVRCRPGPGAYGAAPARVCPGPDGGPAPARGCAGRLGTVRIPHGPEGVRAISGRTDPPGPEGVWAAPARVCPGPYGGAPARTGPPPTVRSWQCGPPPVILPTAAPPSPVRPNPAHR